VDEDNELLMETASLSQTVLMSY